MEGGIEQVEPNAVVGITNGGGIRAAIQPGDVTMKDINTVLPFGNTVAVVYVTGAELFEALNVIRVRACLDYVREHFHRDDSQCVFYENFEITTGKNGFLKLLGEFRFLEIF